MKAAAVLLWNYDFNLTLDWVIETRIAGFFIKLLIVVKYIESQAYTGW